MRLLLLASLICGPLAGCATFSHQPVADNVVRSREQCQAGLEAARLGRTEQASEMFAAAVKLCPVDERARRLHAESLWQQGEATLAIDEMQQASRLSGGDAEVLVRLGEMHLAAGNQNRAAHFATKAIGAAPQLAAAWALEGDVLRSRGELAEALARYHRVLSYQPNFPAVQFAVSEIYLQQGRYSRCLATLAALRQQYEIESAPQRLYVLRAECLASLGRTHEAAGELELAARIAPPTPDLLYRLADCRWRSGQPAAARAAAEQALALAPGHAGSQRLMAQLEHTRY